MDHISNHRASHQGLPKWDPPPRIVPGTEASKMKPFSTAANRSGARHPSVTWSSDVILEGAGFPGNELESRTPASQSQEGHLEGMTGPGEPHRTVAAAVWGLSGLLHPVWTHLSPVLVAVTKCHGLVL